jgi:histidine triad (HIT) family protein
MVDDCLFCKIVAGEIPATKVIEDEHTLTFTDIDPKAPTHVLVVPKRHFADLIELSADPSASAALVRAVAVSAETLGLTDFRVVFNTGAQAGQTVFHVHAHLLGGRSMKWPPG